MQHDTMMHLLHISLPFFDDADVTICRHLRRSYAIIFNLTSVFIASSFTPTVHLLAAFLTYAKKTTGIAASLVYARGQNRKLAKMGY